MEHGCEHCRRRCNIMASCCKQVFPCFHCHSKATVCSCSLSLFFSKTKLGVQRRLGHSNGLGSAHPTRTYVCTNRNIYAYLLMFCVNLIS
ncbi:unnamed protein product [Urochloa humidicola]